MKRKIWKTAFLAVMGMILPLVGFGQETASGMYGMHKVLEQLYEEMVPLYSQLIGIGQGIAGFAATWYIASRVWRHIANAEPIDFYPLFRPFVLGFCIMIFPSVLGIINGVMKPVVTATAAMVDGSNQAVAILLKKKEEAIRKTPAYQMYVGDSGWGNREIWYKHTYGVDQSQQGPLGVLGNEFRFTFEKAGYVFRNTVKEGISELLHLLFQAAALCIDTLRTFQMVVLAILGPLVFGLAVFDGFQHTLAAWIARYINVFLWLPVANIFGSIIGKIQERMLELDISEVSNYGDTLFSRTDLAYMVFLIIGIIGYWTVPSVANYIVHAGGGSMTQKVSSMVNGSFSKVSNGAGNISKQVKNGFSAPHQGAFSGDKGTSSGGGFFGDKLKGNS